jgi:hypothetical protein
MNTGETLWYKSSVNEPSLPYFYKKLNPQLIAGTLHQHGSPQTYIVSKGMVHAPQISSIVLICSGECLTKDLGSG